MDFLNLYDIFSHRCRARGLALFSSFLTPTSLPHGLQTISGPLEGAIMTMRTIGLTVALAFSGLALAEDTGDAQSGKKPEPAAKATSKPRVTLETNFGNIVLQLDPEKAPITTTNFLGYVSDGFYDGTIFHRVISTFMIQGGGFELVDGKGTQKKTKAPIKNEAKNGLKNVRGAISMARTSAPDSATTQFFINVVDNPGLDPKSADNPRGFSPDGYAVFGMVVEGMDVVDKIKSMDTGVKRLKARHPSGQLLERPMSDVPLQNAVIKKASVAK